MANRQGTLVLCILMLLIHTQEGQAKHSPQPIAQPVIPPSPASQPTSPPMYGVTQGSLHPQECAGRCSVRCSATQYKKPCMFFCHKCCAKCLCAPPGTYGNKQFCPCYNNWKTKRGSPECP